MTAEPVGLPEDWRTLDDAGKALLVQKLQRIRDAAARARWEPYPWQRPHVHPDGREKVCDESCHELPLIEVRRQGVWLQLGGRGTGKTDGSAQYVADHVRGPACDPRLPGGHRIAIIGPTLGDAVESCVNGPSGLATHYPGCHVWSSAGGTFVRFPNGALAKVFGASTPDDVERLRAGGNRCLAWWEELAAWRRLEECMDHSRLGLRLGAAVAVASTTPKVRKPILKLVDSDPKVILTRGRTRDAVHLDPETRESYEDRYAGTRTGRQELDGELLRDVEGALWTLGIIDRAHARGVDVNAIVNALARIVVSVDPAVSNTEESDETGIIVAGSTARDHCPICGQIDAPHAFVLADYSGKYAPSGWTSATLNAYDEFEADAVVAEVNNGGDLVEEALRAASERKKRGHVPYRAVRASRGKKVRAEPVAVLYGNVDPTLGPLRPTRVHHLPGLMEVEEQQTGWTPEDADSPDRMDALVWALTHLLVKRSGGASSVAG